MNFDFSVSMKKKIKITLDCGMVLLLPLLMTYSLVGEAAHEYLGIVMFLLFIAHHILNIAWWKHIFHGKYTPFRILGTTVNLALAIIMLALPISGMILSRHVFSFLHFNGASTARTVHLLASYWGLVLMSFHAGMHGQMIVKGLLRKNKSSLLKMISYTSVSLLVVLGVLTLKQKNIVDYLFLRSQYVLVDFSQPVILAFVDYLLVSILFMIMGFYIAKLTNSNFVRKHFLNREKRL